MKIGKFLMLIGFFASFFQACEESEAPNAKFSGPGYLPLAVGNYWTYQMDQIDYLVLGNDTSSYELRELISDSLVATSGEVTYLISRQRRNPANQEWRTDSIWSVRKNQQQVVVTENGRSFVKLVFPVMEGQTWDGNAFNNLGVTTFSYETVLTPDILSTAFGSDTISAIRTVLSNLVSPIVGTDQRSEIYVNGIGLVQKDLNVINLCTDNTKCPDNFGDTLSGIFLRQVLIDYGQL